MPRRLRLYTDENVDPRLAAQLNEQGYDALSCREASNANQALPDEWQLEFAAAQGRAILTYNVVDFIPLIAAWQAQGKEHHGIIFANPMPLGELIHRTARHLDAFSADDHYNLALYLI